MNFETVRDVIAESLGCDVDKVTMEAKLVEDLGADSLASVELLMAIEEATGVSIDDELMPSIKTVADIMKVIEENGEELLSTPDTDEELDEIYNLFMERFFEDEEE